MNISYLPISIISKRKRIKHNVYGLKKTHCILGKINMWSWQISVTSTTIDSFENYRFLHFHLQGLTWKNFTPFSYLPFTWEHLFVCLVLVKELKTQIIIIPIYSFPFQPPSDCTLQCAIICHCLLYIPLSIPSYFKLLIIGQIYWKYVYLHFYISVKLTNVHPQSKRL